jgi:hypothetical protein
MLGMIIDEKIHRPQSFQCFCLIVLIMRNHLVFSLRGHKMKGSDPEAEVPDHPFRLESGSPQSDGRQGQVAELTPFLQKPVFDFLYGLHVLVGR